MKLFLAGLAIGLLLVPRPLPAADNDRIVNRAVVWQTLESSVALYLLTPTSPPTERFFCGGTVLTVSTVITALHCVDGGRTVQVRTHDGQSIGATIERVCVECDLALLKLAQPATKAKPATISTDVAAGDYVIEVGSPNRWPFTPTFGRISEVIPKFGFDNCPDDRKEIGTKPQQVLRVDINTFFGDSGGGLFDDRGNLIGVGVRLETPGEDCGPYFGEHIIFGYSVGPVAILDFLKGLTL